RNCAGSFAPSSPLRDSAGRGVRERERGRERLRERVGEVSAPAAVVSDVGGAGEGGGFAEEACDGRAVDEVERADAERWGNGGDEMGPGVGGDRPDLEFDRVAFAGGDADQAGFGRGGAGERV